MVEIRVFRVGRQQEGIGREAVEELHGKKAVDDGAIREFLDDPACYLMAAVEGERVVGSLNGYALRKPHRRERQFLLYGLDVREEWRGRGIGRKLVREFVEEARKVGAYGVWVVSNEGNRAAMKVYEVCGFRRVNRDDVMMEMGIFQR
jgi:predicted N-acetyltransferase YhbS